MNNVMIICIIGVLAIANVILLCACIETCVSLCFDELKKHLQSDKDIVQS